MVKRPEGCRLLHIATQTISEAGVVTYETPIPVLGLENITTTNNYAEGVGFSDNMQDTSKKKPTFIDMAITLREISNSLESKIMGKKYASGRKLTNVSDQAPVVAVLYQQTNSDGSYVNRVIYNCKLSRDETVNTTTKDGIEFNSVTLSGKGIPLPTTGDLDLSIESDDAAASAEDLANFFKKVILPTDPTTPKV